METVFSLDADGGVEFQWKAEHQLLIRYWPLARVLRREGQVGSVRIEYLPHPCALVLVRTANSCP